MVYFCKYRRKPGGSLAKCARHLELFLALACGIYNYLDKNFNIKRHKIDHKRLLHNMQNTGNN